MADRPLHDDRVRRWIRQKQTTATGCPSLQIGSRTPRSSRCSSRQPRSSLPSSCSWLSSDEASGRAHVLSDGAIRQTVSPNTPTRPGCRSPAASSDPSRLRLAASADRERVKVVMLAARAPIHLPPACRRAALRHWAPSEIRTVHDRPGPGFALIPDALDNVEADHRKVTTRDGAIPRSQPTLRSGYASPGSTVSGGCRMSPGSAARGRVGFAG